MNPLHHTIIQNYIAAYNRFDVIGMTQDFHPDIIFEHVANDVVALKTEGIDAFRKQAESALGFFSERAQHITSWGSQYDVVSIDINYKATLQVDLPNGMKTGDVMKLKGKSVFTLMNDKIIMIQDIS